jgi:hypothetical protein
LWKHVESAHKKINIILLFSKTAYRSIISNN